MHKKLFNLFAALLLGLLAGCSSKPSNTLKIAASAVPHAEMLEFIKPELQAKGITLDIVVIDDYNLPNRALATGEIDANFFQHLPFLEEQIKEFKYPIVSIAKIEIEPMGVYSEKVRSLSALKNYAVIAIPNDPTNEGRALLLLQKEGLITLDKPNILDATVLNIAKNPKDFKFIEAEAAMLPRTLSDVDAAIINTNYALQANLFPATDAIALESKDSPYVNVLVVRKDDVNRPEIVALKEAMTSKKMRDFIIERYKGAVIPAF
jgi:D-methionine transport system substrate-binding protein